MESKDLYKLMRIPSVADALAKRSQNIKVERQEKRREFFWGSRVDLEKSPTVDNKKISRLEMLQKWKAEKMKKLEEEKKKQKPVFKVGVVHRKITGSPVLTQLRNYSKKTTVTQQTHQKPQKSQPNNPENGRTERSGVLTRAKAKTMGIKAVKVTEVNPIKQKGLNNKFYKIEGGKKKQIDSHVFKVPDVVTKLPCQGLTYPYSPKVLKRNEKTIKLNESKLEVKAKEAQQKMEINTTPKDKCLKENIVQEESIPEEVISQPEMISPTENKKSQEDDYQPIVYSPFVTVRSGKKPKRKSRKSLTMDVEEQIKKEEDVFKCRIFSFRKYIECEKKRLLETCDKWKHIYQEFEEVPTDVEGDIDSVIGKTNLLTSDKFMQFKGLIDKCENGDPFVKIDDLQGFQDWVSIEVERIDAEFHNLEKLKCNGWKRETVHVEASKVRKVKPVKNCSKKPAGSSNIRSHILAARKLLKEGNANGVNESQLATALTVKAVTPKKNGSLLKDVLNSETKKKNEAFENKSPAIRERRNSGLEIMIATQKNKFPTPVKLQRSPLLTDFEVFVGKEETPSKGILKKTPKPSKGRVTFKNAENLVNSDKSLNGKYFQSSAEETDEVLAGRVETPSRSASKRTIKTPNSSKGRVTFKKHNDSLTIGGRGLSEKYFQPLTDDDMSPLRTVLGDLGNVTPAGMQTRSRARQMSFSPMLSPQVH